MAMSYRVRFWDIRERPGRRKSFEVRWTVNTREKSESFATKGLAESRRSKLMTMAREGEPFDERTGLPASELRAIKQKITWYQHARDYIDQRWDRTPGGTRRTMADALATITPALVEPGAQHPEPRVLRRALYSWAFNKKAWQSPPPEEWRKALAWIEQRSLPIGRMEDAIVLRQALDALSLKLDGKPAAAKTALRKKAALSDILSMAVEKGYFTANPLHGVRWQKPYVAEEVDPECVPNPHQVSLLLEAVREQGGRGPHLEAFFGCMYYAAMRPAEVIRLERAQCRLPDRGWGLLTLRGGVVLAGKEWTDDGTAHEVHPLKKRALKETRPVPIPPVFVTMIREHIDRYGTAPDGRLFRSGAGLYVQSAAYGKTWTKARGMALTEEEQSSLVAKRPYDLRHAGISFWLHSGVDPAECARRAGQSIEVMFRVYAKVLANGQERANQRIEEAMKQWKPTSPGAQG
ncbi:tyrosine-type recombinase/integrase [Streptomyces griseocarneus]|uniref:tyrosine-type recombinase/integrase n=1 Tax=Streptomyces griseocarneus TaxID=51201 RepID=UPI00167D592A|nr:integrase [Streptomyces griseocarneus]MBZ6477521.1 integrase [Streptomyces griseocarneus]GHG82708.1 site-specific integrase [Streptomyces griseocarneus]